MAHKTCTSCRGTGSGTTTERVPNPAGGMFQAIQLRKRCMHCVGSGTTWTPDAGGGAIPAGPGTGRGWQRAGRDFETVASEWIFLGVWGAVACYGITFSALEWYWPVGAGFLAGLAGRKLFNGPLRFLLTWLKYLLIVACAGAVLAVAARVNHGGI